MPQKCNRNQKPIIPSNIQGTVYNIFDSRSDNIKVMTYDKHNEVIKEIFYLILSRYQIGLERSMKVNDFIFEFAQLLYYKCHKISFECGGSYIAPPD